MTSRERILEAFHIRTPDRVPVTPFGLGKLDPAGKAARKLIETADVIIDTGASGNPIWGDGVPLEVVRDGDTEVRTLHTPQGELRSVRRFTSITSATTEFFCETAEDAEKWLSLPFKPSEPGVERYMRWVRDVGDDALVMVGIGDGICLPAELFSPEDFSLLWADAPDVMRKLVRTVANRVNEFVEKLCEAGVDAFRIVGGEYASVQLGPQAFQELVVEPDRELTNIMRKHGAVSYFHNHGPVTRYYDQFLEIGINALDPLEAPPWGDCDLAEAKRRIGHRICLVGNLDDMEILEKLPWNEIETIAEERLAAAGPDGFVLGGTASGTYTERGAEMFRRLVPVSEAHAKSWV